MPIDNYEKTPKGYRQGDKTFYSDFHLGIDLIIPIGTPIYAPTNGTAKYSYGNEGGNTLYFTDEKGRLHRFLHLNTWSDKKEFKEGERIAYSGNTGLSTSPHLHWDLSKNGKLELNNRANFLNPELWLKDTMNYENKIIRNQKTGGFALVIHNKKYVFGDNLDVKALLTFMQRSGIDDEKIINISNEEFEKISLSDGLKF